MWYLLRDRRLAAFTFTRQVPIGPWIADFVCRRAKLVVEVDGGQHAENERDARRDADLRSRGYRVVRYWNYDVLKDSEAVVSDVLRVLQDEGEA
jgi:very-short-patch-repair endonuclease